MTGDGSRHGHLADDGERVQCHECGRWLKGLAGHLAVHDLTAGEYRTRHGLAATTALASAGTTARLSHLGRRRRDAADLPQLDVEASRTTRSRPFPRYQMQASTREAIRTWRAAEADAVLAEALSRAGWDTLEGVIGWADQQGLRWVEVAAMLQITPAQLRVHARRHQVSLTRSRKNTQMLALAQQHHHQHGNLTDTVGDLRSWLSKWRYRARNGVRHPVIDRLTLIDPGWVGPQPRAARTSLATTSRDRLQEAAEHVRTHGDLTRTTGPLSRWLGARRYLAHQGDQGPITQALDRLDPAWSQPRTP